MSYFPRYDRWCNLADAKWVDLPPSLKSKYDVIYDAISKTNIFFKGIVRIIALYSLSIGYKTDFRKRWITYSNYVGNSPTIATYQDKEFDFRNALLDFSFRGRCMVRFTIHAKGDEMWIGVVADLRNLEERRYLERGSGQLWNFYCGRTRDTYYEVEDNLILSRKEMLANFKPELDCEGNRDGAYGSLHFPGRLIRGKLVPCNTGDVVDLEVDAQAKTFKVTVNGVLQAYTEAPGMPDQLSFWLQLDSTNDRVEVELLDYSFEKKREQMDEKTIVLAKYV